MREGRYTEQYRSPFFVTSIVVIPFDPSTTCAGSWPVAINSAAITLAKCALNPREPERAEPIIHFAFHTSSILYGVVFSTDETIAFGTRTSAMAIRPRPVMAFIQAGFLSMS